MAFDLSKLGDLVPFLQQKKPVTHELKWKIPEARLSSPVEDAEKTVAQLRKLCVFRSGGQFQDAIYAKDYGEGIFAYFIVRTDPKTEKETLVFDGYMIQEEDEQLNLGLDVGVEMMKNLSGMGYKQELQREVTEWNFTYKTVPVSAYDIADFGAFVQASVPATKFENVRRTNEKAARELFEKLKVAQTDVIPTDVITLQIMMLKEQPQPKGPKQMSFGGKFALGGGPGSES